MLSSLVFFALLHCASGRATTQWPPRHALNSDRMVRRDLSLGSKVALGLCVPAAFLVVALGCGVMYCLSKQVREDNERRAQRLAGVGLNDVPAHTAGAPGPKPATPPPPPYTKDSENNTRDAQAAKTEYVLPEVAGLNAPSSDAPGYLTQSDTPSTQPGALHSTSAEVPTTLQTPSQPAANRSPEATV